ncbi:hypothetical protein [Nonomuraea zeae]|uniref:Uncharacterized protein n=1 Tax=Nonomuraea zeae TaxID=1642303 RepID=A0A5S4GIU1_9ACTN|nr:hypothetical protein [Nonomuraea zeae]TMR32833.1 hypothetical protein ETD85_21640 [Nonomuraea zeae]
MTDDFPEMPDFDPRLTRKAVRRGLFRTSSSVLAVLLVLALVATYGSMLAQTRGDREQRMTDVLGTAFKLYNPAYRVVTGTCCETTPWSMSFEVSAAPLRAFGGFWPSGGETYTISQTLFGRVAHLPLGSTANTRLSLQLYDLGGTLARKENVRKALARLPGDLRALAAVEFAAPLKGAELKSFLDQREVCAESVVYERRTGSLPITWGEITWDRGTFAEGKEGCGVGLGNFRSWVSMLRDHDEPNLHRFDLSLSRLRKAAADGLAYAYVDQSTSIAELRKVIEDPRVRTVRLADVTFDLDRP